MKSYSSLVPRGQSASDFKLRAGVSLSHEQLLELAELGEFTLSASEDNRVRVRKGEGELREASQGSLLSKPKEGSYFEGDGELIELFWVLRTSLPEPRGAVKTHKGVPVLRFLLTSLTSETVRCIHGEGGKAAVFVSAGRFYLHLYK